MSNRELSRDAQLELYEPSVHSEVGLHHDVEVIEALICEGGQPWLSNDAVELSDEQVLDGGQLAWHGELVRLGGAEPRGDAPVLHGALE